MIEIVDRYSATGTPHPDDNSCDECEGMGMYPCQASKLNKEACKYGEVSVIGQKEKHSIHPMTTTANARNNGYNLAIKHFEQNILKELEEV